MILLSSVSFAYGAIDSKFVYIKNENMFDSNFHLTSYEISKSNSFIINLRDGAEAKLAGDERNKNNSPYNHIISLYERTTGTAAWSLPQENLNEHEKTIQKLRFISIQLSDGIKSTSPTNDDEKIFVIKNNTHRQTTWEGIFPSDRPKNNTKSPYKTIQDDYELTNKNSQNQESNDEQMILQNAGSNVFVVNLFDGVAASFGGSDGSKNDKTNLDFIGPYNITTDDRHSIPVNREAVLENVEFTDEFENVIQHIVENGNQALLILVVPLAGIIIIRTENEKTRFYQIRRLVSFAFIIILGSMIFVTPHAISANYWGFAFAEEGGNAIGPPSNVTETAPPPSNDSDVPFRPSVSVISASPTSSISSAPGSNCQDSVVFEIGIDESENNSINAKLSLNFIVPSKISVDTVSLFNNSSKLSEIFIESYRCRYIEPLILIVILSMNARFSDK